jgi:tRNA G10  N-methylase Trm11
MTYLAILGRQPAIGIAELESRFSADALNIIAPDIAQIETDASVEVFDQLGGVTKVAKLLAHLDFSDWRRIESYVLKTFPHHLHHIPEGKITLGLSVYGLNIAPKQIQATALSLKKVIRQTGRSVRIVPNTEAVLNTAQVIHNKLTSTNGHELLIIKNNSGVLLAQTQWVQDIDAYRRRDQERPARDARVGMLPPKLAQIIINLSGATQGRHLLDPFCGTGVVLQEGMLAGMQVLGTDLEPRMIEYSEKNLDWFCDNHLIGKESYSLEVRDATTHQWNDFQVIACETYLGRPFSSQPDEETLRKVIQDCNVIHKKFLQNVARQTKSGFRMCIAVPAWKTKNGFKHLPTLDNLGELGYTRMSFVHAKTQNLIYHRQDQVVARELVVLIRK